MLGGRPGCTGIETAATGREQPAARSVVLRAYFSSLTAARRAAQDVPSRLRRWAYQAGLGDDGALIGPARLEAVPAVEAAGRKAWAATLEPVRAGGGVVTARGRVTATRSRTARPKRRGALYRVVVPPGMAFGTGHHPTTQQALWCLELAIKEMRGSGGDGPLVVDVGTGSGVLAIAARELGAGRVVAVDTDPLAIPIARRNARRNRASGIAFRQGSVTSAARVAGWEAAQVVVANLLAETLVELAASLARLLAGGGLLIGAGIAQEKAGQVVEALEAQGLACEAVGGWSGWVWVAARRRAGDGREPVAGAR